MHICYSRTSVIHNESNATDGFGARGIYQWDYDLTSHGNHDSQENQWPILTKPNFGSGTPIAVH